MKKRKNRWLIILLCIILAFIIYTLVRYPVKASFSYLYGVDIEDCNIVLWYNGQEVKVTDDAVKKEIIAWFDGKLTREMTGDWIGKSAGCSWIVKFSRGNQQVQVSLHPQEAENARIHFEHYDYTLNQIITTKKLQSVFEHALSDAE